MNTPRIPLSDARCVLLAVLRPLWLEFVEADESTGELVIHACDVAAATEAMRGRSSVAGWPVRIREVTPR